VNVVASAVLSCRSPDNLLSVGLPGHFLHVSLDRIGGCLDGLLGLPDYLLGLSFVTKLVVAGQRSGGFLDSTFYHVCFATHDANFFP
jgi:hypothetical protein